METNDLKFGWREIAQASHRSAHTLIKQQQLGTLPITPLKVGHQVAATPAQIEVLKQGGAK